MKKNEKPKKMWGGRFKAPLRPEVERFTASLPFDRRLAAQDVAGSLAWAKALARAKALTAEEASRITEGLKAVGKALLDDPPPWSDSDEDIHSAVERLLTERIGPLGGKLHTGRSRNDQVALDLRLFLREEVARIIEGIEGFQWVLADQAETHIDLIMPGYTHLQRAQPVRYAHHLLAYYEMLERDRQRFSEGLVRINVLPLGSGALAGTNYPVDREALARDLGFHGVSENSLDAVSDRDAPIEVAAAGSLLMMHLSRLCEELVLWSSEEFGFLDLPDDFCTGSSLMPQKKNPDVPELIRAKTGRVYGHLMALLTVMKGLPLAYNKDLQEDKEAVFDTVDTLGNSLGMLADLLRETRPRPEAMARAVQGGGLLATEMADYLVERGLPFREAHEVVGRVVRFGLDHGMEIHQIPLKDLKQLSPAFDKGVAEVLTPEASVERKQGVGGTSRRSVLNRIRKIRGRK